MIQPERGLPITPDTATAVMKSAVMLPRRSAGYEGLLEQGHVLAGLLLDRSKKRCRQRAAKILGDLVAELRLLAGGHHVALLQSGVQRVN